MQQVNLDQLEQQGYTVVKDVLTKEEVDTSRSLFWEWLASLGSGITPDNLESWSDENWPGNIYTGHISNHGISQSEFVWYVRGRPKVRDAFMKIWTNKIDKKAKLDKGLICSMDAVICWRPWWLCDFEDWEPQVEGLHVDQNPLNKPGFHCIQGMIPLYDVNEISGGLQVVPNSHTDRVQEVLKELGPISSHLMLSMIGDYWQLHSKDSRVLELSQYKRLVQAKAGSLILWDSRLIHGGLIGKGMPYVKSGSAPSQTADLLRLAVPICMMPRDGVSEEVLSDRRAAYENRYTMTHWANETNYFRGSDSHAINITKEPPYYRLSNDEYDLL